MTFIQIFALILLLGRIGGSIYLIKVIRIQRALLKFPAVDEHNVVDADVMHFRGVLYHMTLVVLTGQVLPILIDMVGVIAPGRGPWWLIFAYAGSNAFTALTAAALIYKLYEMAVNVKEVTDLERRHMQTKHDKEMGEK